VHNQHTTPPAKGVLVTHKKRELQIEKDEIVEEIRNYSANVKHGLVETETCAALVLKTWRIWT
jgi:hypothetical protein